MSSVVGSLIVKLSAHTAQFTKGMKGSERAAKSSMRSITASFGQIAKAGAVAGAALGTAAATAVVALTKKQAELIDSTAKLARLYGVTTEELSAFQYAVKLSGGQNDAFNMGLQRLTRRTAEAAAGFGEADKSFKEMGIDASKFMGMGLTEKIKTLSRSLEGMGAGDRARLMMPIVDSEALKPWLELLSKSGDEIDRIIRQGKKAGAVFTDMDAKKVEAANNAMSRLSTNLSGFVTELTIGLAPAVEIAGEKLSEMFEGTRTSSGKVFENTNKITTGIIWASEAARDFYSWILKIESSQVRLLRAVARYGSLYGLLAGDEGDLNTFLKTWADELENEVKRIDKIDIAGAFANKQKQLNELADESARKLKDTVAALAEASRIKSVNAELQTMRDKIAAIGKSWIDVSYQKLKGLKATQKELNEFSELAAMFKERTEADNLKKATQSFIDDLNGRIDALGKTADELRLENLIIAGLSPKSEKQIRSLITALESTASSPLLKHGFAGAAQRRSMEAYSAIVQHSYGPHEREQLRLLRASTQAEQKQLGVQNKMLTKLDNQIQISSL